MTLTLSIDAADGSPLAGAIVRVEGHMSHPGMRPVIAVATEQRPGVYRVPFELTMAGDWVLLVSATAPDGLRIEHRIDVPHVRPAE